jgi:membrane protein implicated in regulation of membrane protease activity
VKRQWWLHCAAEVCGLETTLDLNAPTLWWLACGMLVATELATGTFYLLMLALGCAAGALAAHAGLGATPQVVAAAAIGGGATVAWHAVRSRQPKVKPAESNRDVNLDIGQTLHVAAWDAEGVARAQYRGAAWTVRLAHHSTPAAPGEHTIVAVHGNELRVEPVAHH